MRIKKGDNVKILTGKDRGKTGSVSRVIPEEHRVVIEGLNLYKKRIRPKKQGEQGEVVDAPRPMDASNVSIVCKSCSQLTRIGIKKEGKTKRRYCKKCESTI